MSGQGQLTRIWSDDLGRSLLSSLPEEGLTAQWGPLSSGPGESACSAQLQRRRELLHWAQQDPEVRHWIVRAWREAHADVVAAADLVLTEGLSERSGLILEGFRAEDVLLAILTDEFDDGSELAKRFVNGVDSESQRRALLTILHRLVGTPDLAPRRRVRVVILGGHQRDESKLAQRLFEASPFEVRWSPPFAETLQTFIILLSRRIDDDWSKGAGQGGVRAGVGEVGVQGG